MRKTFYFLRTLMLLTIEYSLNLFLFMNYCYSEHLDRMDRDGGGYLERVVVSQCGVDRSDATDIVQSAIDSGANEVIVPNVGYPWIVKPIRLRSNLTLTLMPGVVVEAKKGEFKGGGDSLFSAVNVENLKVSGYGAILRMHKKDYQNKELYEPAEWRMAISLTGCKNVVIEGVRCESSGGDGIYIGATNENSFCENIVIRDVVCWNNHRQGISVISAKNLLIENCKLIGTWGTPPQAGIDFEPNRENEVLAGIVMKNCFISANRGAGILMYLKNLRRTSHPVDIRVERCYIRGGADFGIAIGEVYDEGVNGEILVKDVVIEASKKGGIFVFNKSSRGAVIDFQNSSIINSPPGKEGYPVKVYQLRSGVVESLGGLRFDNLVVIDSEWREPIEVRSVSEKIQVKDIVGSFVLMFNSKAEAKVTGLRNFNNFNLEFLK